ncbi:nickel pincer cofactor biosynthesis protein LarB [candidate division KSB1 bacterium]|nr:nickel pincer cofactor biosynthesis protein LarB [candidate division KSB1 bacterium]
MDIEKLQALLQKVKSGEIDIAGAIQRLRNLPFEDIDLARVDYHRAIRTGIPEVVFCQNKTAEQAITILNRLWQHHERVLATRVSAEMAASIKQQLPEAKYDSLTRLLVLEREPLHEPAADSPACMVLSAGTSDMPVAEEAVQTLAFFGSRVEKAYDVGVAGIHRLFGHLEKMHQADVIICVAGMEGALPSVVAGLVSCPLVAVPTSVGYGASFHGVAPLLTMLNSCAPGVAVVNIDNGFGAAVYAHLILKRIQSGVNK